MEADDVWGKVNRHDDNDDNDTETSDPVQTQIPSWGESLPPTKGSAHAADPKAMEQIAK